MTKVSAKFGLRQSCASALALSAASALWLGCAGAPALAADDGYAPIWDSLGSIIGPVWGGDKPQKQIDYRDQPRLVVPQKMDLPPPAQPPAASAADWPRDQEGVREKAELAAQKKPHPLLGDKTQYINRKFPDPNTVVTTDYTAGQGPGQERCRAGAGQTCDTPTKPSLNWNPLTWVGLQKKPQTVLGPEPERDSLTDPPMGYRAPAEGVGVKVDNN